MKTKWWKGKQACSSLLFLVPWFSELGYVINSSKRQVTGVLLLSSIVKQALILALDRLDCWIDHSSQTQEYIGRMRRRWPGR